MNVVQQFEAKQLAAIQEEKSIPDFAPGDTVRVNVKVREGTRERVQAYEGVCIARAGTGINASFTVRKISYGEGVERVFPLWSPRLDSIELIRRGSVRRAKLYYLRDRRGKSARIAERTSGFGIDTDEEAKEALKQEKYEAKQAKKEEKKEARKDKVKMTKADRKEAKAARIAEKKAAKAAKKAEEEAAAAAEAEGAGEGEAQE